MIRATVFSAVLLAVYLPAALACRCVNTTFKQDVCNAKINVLAKVVARYDECPGKCDRLRDQTKGIFYVMRVVRHFRGQRIEDGVFTMRTGVNGALCGALLTIDELYIFNLDFKRTNENSCPRTYYSLSSCGSQRMWSSVPIEQKRHLSRANAFCGSPAGGKTVL